MKRLMLALALVLFVGLNHVVFAQSEAEALITASVGKARSAVNFARDRALVPRGPFLRMPAGPLIRPCWITKD